MTPISAPAATPTPASITAPTPAPVSDPVVTPVTVPEVPDRQTGKHVVGYYAAWARYSGFTPSNIKDVNS